MNRNDKLNKAIEYINLLCKAFVFVGAQAFIFNIFLPAWYLMIRIEEAFKNVNH